jgi:hypothetical protein
VLGFWRADPLAALIVAVVCLQAGTKAWPGETCDGQATR